jgi:hypothetical protein
VAKGVTSTTFVCSSVNRSKPGTLQIEANRRNAQNSTGPRTDQGKAVSRFNALKTGIDARSHVIPGEDPNVLETLTLDYYERFQPAAPEQRFLIDAMVSAEWPLRRLRKTEAQIWEYGMQSWRPQERLVNSARAYFHREEFLTRLHRRMDNAERSYHRALKQLLQLQSGYPAPAQAKAPTVELPPVEPVPAELEPRQINLLASELGSFRQVAHALACPSPGDRLRYPRMNADDFMDS